ncbi:Flagellar motor protein MotB [Candidatus Magnetomoraceae bacterium gMMP-15]
MTDPLSPKESDKDYDAQSDDNWNELYELLMGPVETNIKKLQHQINYSDLNSIEDAIKSSIRRDRKTLVDALFPVMGPAIRKAISSAILEKIQGFNEILQYSFSFQGLMWRIEAFKTRRSFGEVVLLNTLIYQVEQLFLIHKETGLLIENAVSKEVTAQDPDLVSSMLTAIQDFIKDSFDVEKNEGLETLRIGDKSVWIEQSQHAILAAVIRGNPPVDFQQTLKETLDAISIEEEEALESFDGDVSFFKDTKNYLETCLQSKYKVQKKKISPALWIILALILLLIGSWSFFLYKNHINWTDYLKTLKMEPGLVITLTEKHWDKYHIFGLRDSLSSDPYIMLKKTRLNPDKVIFHLEPYYSLYSAFVLKRAENILDPPKTLRLYFKDGILRAEGEAPHKWIVEARKLAKAIPGITSFNEKALVDTDFMNMESAEKEIEKNYFFFVVNLRRLMPGQKDKINNVVKEMHRLYNHAKVLNKKVIIKIIGHTDSTGQEHKNIKLSKGRANKILSIFLAKGFKKSNFNVIGVGSKKPLRKNKKESGKKFNRCVNFSVILNDLPK